MNYIKQNIISIVTLVVLVGSLLLGGNVAPAPTLDEIVGAVAAVDATTATNQRVFIRGVQIGTTATNRSLVSGLQFGSCGLIVNGSISATSTKNYDCAVTGVVSTDKVYALTLASSTPAGGGVFVVGANASSTAGFITVTVTNLTGASYNPATTGFGSSTPYLVLR